MFYTVLCVWVLSLGGLLFLVEQSSFYSIAAFYIAAFASYYYLIRHGSEGLKHSFNVLLYAAIAIRVLAVFAFPGLSDDIYRFIWDGRLAVAGYHPFENLPSYYLASGNEVAGISKELFDQLNSQNYYTIYPTISQWVFTVSAWLFPESVYGFSLSMKGILAAMDIGTLLILKHIVQRYYNWKPDKVLLYALNPLVIVEISGNGHFEGAMIFFMVLSVLYLLKDQSKVMNTVLSALFLAAAVASKMLPLMFLPLLLVVIPWKKALQYYCLVGVWVLVLFAPMMSSQLIEHLGESLNLYFQKFEFNASIYYIIRWIGFQIKGWNIIHSAGPLLGVIVFVSIWLLTFFNRNINQDNSLRANWPRLSMWALVIYLSLATIVHPWYITTLVALSVFTNYRFPMVWSGLIVLTYINYSYGAYFENLWIVGLEYLLVFGMLIFEIKKYNFDQNDPLEGIFK